VNSRNDCDDGNSQVLKAHATVYITSLALQQSTSKRRPPSTGDRL